jgi:hypothetical protein
MTELELALRRLGRELDLPPAPDVAAHVRSRLHRHRRRRPWLVVALALLAAVAVAFAVPQARTAILRFFHIRGAQVTIVERPRVPSARADLGTPTALDALPFRPVLPAGQRPVRAWTIPGGLWLELDSGLLLAEIRTGDPWFLKKVGGQGTKVEYVTVGGEPGIWIGGAPHALYLPGEAPRRAGDTLLWQRGELTLRLEGAPTKARALAIALAIG